MITNVNRAKPNEHQKARNKQDIGSARPSGKQPGPYGTKSKGHAKSKAMHDKIRNAHKPQAHKR